MQPPSSEKEVSDVESRNPFMWLYGVLVERVLRAIEGTTLDLVGGNVENEVEEEEKGKRRQRRRGGREA